MKIKEYLIRILGRSVMAFLLLIATSVYADNVTVGCPGAVGTFDYTSLNDALTALHAISFRDHYITVAGKCTENVVVEDFGKLTIAGTNGAKLVMPATSKSPALLVVDSDKIVLRGLTIQGAEDQVFPSVVFIQRSDMSVYDSTFELSPDTAFFVTDKSSVWLRGCIFQDNGSGLVVRSASLSKVGDVGTYPVPSLFRRNSIGIEVTTSECDIYGNTTIQDNSVGLTINGGQVILCCGDGSRKITNNSFGITSDFGTIIDHGPLLMQGNGFGFSLKNTSLRLLSSSGMDILENGFGISASLNSALELTGAHIENNALGIDLVGNSSAELSSNSRVKDNGTGILLRDNSFIRLFDSVITGNSGDGLRIETLSTAQVGSGNTIKENDGYDLVCSQNSFANGDTSGIGKIFCPGVNGANIIYGCFKAENGQLRVSNGPNQCLDSELPIILSGAR